jgi:hypothetical protein
VHFMVFETRQALQSVQVNVLIFILMFSKQYLMIITALGVL